MNDQYQTEEQNDQRSGGERVDLDFIDASVLKQLKSEQDLTRGILFASGAAIISGVVWAAITISTEYQIGFMAIGVGLLVGLAMRKGGKGIEQIFGVVGAALALLGCLLGNVFTYYWLGLDVAGVGLSEMISLMFQDFMDFLFYGLAIYEGYKLSFRKVTEGEVAQYVSAT